MKYWKSAFIGLGILPITFAISILAFYIHAGQILGRLPSYNQPDPKQLEIYANYSPFVDWTAEIWLWSFPVWFLMTIVYLIIKRKNNNWTPIIISGIGQILGILIFFSRIMEWYAD